MQRSQGSLPSPPRGRGKMISHAGRPVASGRDSGRRRRGVLFRRDAGAFGCPRDTDRSRTAHGNESRAVAAVYDRRISESTASAVTGCRYGRTCSHLVRRRLSLKCAGDLSATPDWFLNFRLRSLSVARPAYGVGAADRHFTAPGRTGLHLVRSCRRARRHTGPSAYSDCLPPWMRTDTGCAWSRVFRQLWVATGRISCPTRSR